MRRRGCYHVRRRGTATTHDVAPLRRTRRRCAHVLAHNVATSGHARSAASPVDWCVQVVLRGTYVARRLAEWACSSALRARMARAPGAGAARGSGTKYCIVLLYLRSKKRRRPDPNRTRKDDAKGEACWTLESAGPSASGLRLGSGPVPRIIERRGAEIGAEAGTKGACRAKRYYMAILSTKGPPARPHRPRLQG